MYLDSISEIYKDHINNVIKIISGHLDSDIKISKESKLKKISNITSNINQNDSETYCSSCGTPTTKGSYCSDCGLKTDKDNKSEKRIPFFPFGCL